MTFLNKTVSEAKLKDILKLAFVMYIFRTIDKSGKQSWISLKKIWVDAEPKKKEEVISPEGGKVMEPLREEHE